MNNECHVIASAVAIITVSPALSHDEEHSHREPGTAKLGTVKFPSSCTPAAQPQFGNALTMLHSFFYPATLQALYPDDSEAAIFCAPALNETALPSGKSYVKQRKAAAILEKIAQLPRLLNRAATSSWRTSMLNPADRCVLRSPIACAFIFVSGSLFSNNTHREKIHDSCQR